MPEDPAAQSASVQPIVTQWILVRYDIAVMSISIFGHLRSARSFRIHFLHMVSRPAKLAIREDLRQCVGRKSGNRVPARASGICTMNSIQEQTT